MMKMDVREIIAKKRDGGRLSTSDIDSFVSAVVNGDASRAQAAAFLALSYVNGLDTEETAQLTLAMADSGERLSWISDLPLIDKHSTGGVGDKISLILAPLWVCLGYRVPMISGRGLGHTGGTLDKLESILGFETHRTRNQLKAQFKNVGCFICAQSEQLAPADRLFYSLRNETATVPSIPLIVASILSKKIAEGISSLVMDVKWGSGAFMKTRPEAVELAQVLELVGRQAGLDVHSHLTQMSEPLGRAVGNALEVEESIACLKGEGPQEVRELVCRLSGSEQAAQFLASGAAYEVFEKMVHAQGGDLNRELRGKGTEELCVLATQSGRLTVCDAYLVGMAVVHLGGGRIRAEDTVDHGVGVWVEAKVGQYIEKGEILFRIQHRRKGLERAKRLLSKAIVIVEES